MSNYLQSPATYVQGASIYISILFTVRSDLFTITTKEGNIFLNNFWDLLTLTVEPIETTITFNHENLFCVRLFAMAVHFDIFHATITNVSSLG
jgi:hypothetical protein